MNGWNSNTVEAMKMPIQTIIIGNDNLVLLGALKRQCFGKNELLSTRNVYGDQQISECSKQRQAINMVNLLNIILNTSTRSAHASLKIFYHGI